ncbi:NAD-dependent epimerase/dehydratase family protein [Candidatus Nitrosacidococcus tergens]|uniref:NAD-dependent epimerase/dehydratase domain-containing protein n=1 Tax=Candidatus Nitrosacidococcus tergens TaxID=553981 RepID=A0A7G1Q9G8_9GAMM|nr:NAD-dependent epimerase/dehydratase family protein [Candidatus Nitrosacidococcus tergens]CAB1275817.1 protein of unknown function [Candidatus Nitrosacidococcus tergens]
MLPTKTVLITGGRGFIGVNLTSLLLSKSCDLHVLDNLKRSSPTGWQPSLADFKQVDIINNGEI